MKPYKSLAICCCLLSSLAWAEKAPDYTPSLEEMYGVPTTKDPASTIWHQTLPNGGQVVLLGRWCESRKGMLEWVAKDVMAEGKPASTYKQQMMYMEALEPSGQIKTKGCWIFVKGQAQIVIRQPSAKGNFTSIQAPMEEFQRIPN